MKNDPETKASIRQAIAEKEHLTVEEIAPELHVNMRGEGVLRPLAGERFAWDSYTVGYKQRTLEEEVLFDQEKYDADLAVAEQTISAITEALQIAGSTDDIDLV